MFERREVLSYTDPDLDDVNNKTIKYWTRMGFHVMRISPRIIRGVSYNDDIGLRSEFILRSFDDGNRVNFELTLKAELSSTGLVLLVVFGIFFWPVALLLGLMSHSRYTDNALNHSYNFWEHMNYITGQTGKPSRYYAPYPPVSGYPGSDMRRKEEKQG